MLKKSSGISCSPRHGVHVEESVQEYPVARGMECMLKNSSGISCSPRHGVHVEEQFGNIL